MASTEELNLKINLIDGVSKKLGATTEKLDKMMGNSKKMNKLFSFVNIGAAAMTAGFVGVTVAANNMNKAMGRIKSLDVTETAMANLEKQALKTSVEFGKSATDIINSAYDIQSAMGVTFTSDTDLANITHLSTMLATATDSTSDIITDYVGTMSGVFAKDMQNMGNIPWMEDLTAKTAKAVEMFKTNGSKIATSFSALGTSASSLNIPLAEQMAILGTLGNTMGGGEAATKYKSILTNLSKAGGELGLDFTDSNGQVLPMIEVLEKLQGKMEGLSAFAQKNLLKKAFTSDEAVSGIMNLMQNTATLNGGLDAIGKTKGLDSVMNMAKPMINEFDQMKSSVTALGITLGQIFLPALLSIAGALASLLVPISKFIGDSDVAKYTIVALTTALAGLFIAMKVQAGWAALGVAFPVLIGQLNVAIAATLGFAKALMVSLFVAMKSVAIGIGTLLVKGFVMAVPAIYAATVAAWNFTAALWANPITWIVAAIIGFIATLVALVVYWDDVVTCCVGGWLLLKDAFLAGVEIVSNVFGTMWESIKEIFSAIWDYVTGFFGRMWDKIKSVGGAIASFFGIGDSEASVNLSKSTETQLDVLSSKPLKNMGTSTVNTTNTTNWGGVTINASNGMSPAMLEEWRLQNG